MNVRKLSTVSFFVSPLLWAALLLAFVSWTNPRQVGPAGVLGVFVLIYLLVFSFLCMMYKMSISLLGVILRKEQRTKRAGYQLASVIAVGPILAVGLNTLGRLDVLGFIMVVVLISVGCFYILRQSR